MRLIDFFVVLTHAFPIWFGDNQAAWGASDRLGWMACILVRAINKGNAPTSEDHRSFQACFIMSIISEVVMTPLAI